MSALRVVGGIFAVAFFALALIRYQRRRISRLNLIISSLISAVVLLLAIAPGLFNPLFEVFNFEPGNGQRLTAVLLFAVAIQFLLLIRMQSEVDTNERGIRQLVESFGQSAFDWDVAADLPAGKRIVVVSPAFNEAENVGAVIDAMPREVEGYHVVPIVVDDHSDDGTAGRGAGGGRAGGEPADPAGRGARAPGGLRHRAQARRRHRRDDGRRRPAPARGAPHGRRADHRGPRRPRERVQDARRLRAREPDPSPRRPLLLARRDDPDRTAGHRHLERLPRDPGRHAPGARSWSRTSSGPRRSRSRRSASTRGSSRCP